MLLKEDEVKYFNLISVNVFLSFMSLTGSDEAATKDKVRLILQTLIHKIILIDFTQVCYLSTPLLQPWSCS